MASSALMAGMGLAGLPAPKKEEAPAEEEELADVPVVPLVAPPSFSSRALGLPVPDVVDVGAEEEEEFIPSTAPEDIAATEVMMGLPEAPPADDSDEDAFIDEATATTEAEKKMLASSSPKGGAAMPEKSPKKNAARGVRAADYESRVAAEKKQREEEAAGLSTYLQISEQQPEPEPELEPEPEAVAEVAPVIETEEADTIPAADSAPAIVEEAPVSEEVAIGAPLEDSEVAKTEEDAVVEAPPVPVVVEVEVEEEEAAAPPVPDVVEEVVAAEEPAPGLPAPGLPVPGLPAPESQDSATQEAPVPEPEILCPAARLTDFHQEEEEPAPGLPAPGLPVPGLPTPESDAVPQEVAEPVPEPEILCPAARLTDFHAETEVKPEAAEEESVPQGPIEAVQEEQVQEEVVEMEPVPAMGAPPPVPKVATVVDEHIGKAFQFGPTMIYRIAENVTSAEQKVRCALLKIGNSSSQPAEIRMDIENMSELKPASDSQKVKSTLEVDFEFAMSAGVYELKEKASVADVEYYICQIVHESKPLPSGGVFVAVSLFDECKVELKTPSDFAVSEDVVGRLAAATSVTEIAEAIQSGQTTKKVASKRVSYKPEAGAVAAVRQRMLSEPKKTEDLKKKPEQRDSMALKTRTGSVAARAAMMEEQRRLKEEEAQKKKEEEARVKREAEEEAERKRVEEEEAANAGCSCVVL